VEIYKCVKLSSIIEEGDMNLVLIYKEICPYMTTNECRPTESFKPTNYISCLIYKCRINADRLCGLVVRVPGYRCRGPRFDSRRYQIFCEVVALERCPLSLVRIIEELLE
jgi:hypothetical protein